MNIYYYYAIIAVAAVIAYMMAVDKNVAIFIDLMIRYAWVQVKRAWWIVRFHPINPIPRWTLNWRVERMTRKLEKDLKINTKDLTDPD
jgi:hypothetical protein